MKRQNRYYGEVSPDTLLREAWEIRSGPALWRFDTTTGDDVALLAAADADYTLRRLAVGVAESWLRQVHRTVEEAGQRGFSLFPSFVPGATGQTAVRHSGRVCDLALAPAGVAVDSPSPKQLAAVGRVLARLHALGESALGPADRPDLVAGSRAALLRLAWDPRSHGRDPWQAAESLARFFGTLDPARPAVALARAGLEWLERNPAPVDLAVDPPALALGDLRPRWIRFRGDDVATLVFPDLLSSRPPLGDVAAALSSLGRWEVARCREVLAGYSDERPIALERVAALPALAVRHALGCFREATRAGGEAPPVVLDELKTLLEVEPLAFARQVLERS